MTRLLLSVFLIALLPAAKPHAALPDALRWNAADTIAVTKCAEAPDSACASRERITPKESTAADENRNWWHLFKQGKLEMTDKEDG